jgi:hypothetical protein
MGGGRAYRRPSRRGSTRERFRTGASAFGRLFDGAARTAGGRSTPRADGVVAATGAELVAAGAGDTGAGVVRRTGAVCVCVVCAGVCAASGLGPAGSDTAGLGSGRSGIEPAANAETGAVAAPAHSAATSTPLPSRLHPPPRLPLTASTPTPCVCAEP